jgi:ATP-dependent helicase/nuclease subunit A
MTCQEDGIQKYRNIEKLMYIAKKFDSEELFTLEQFALYIKLLMDNGTDDSEAALDTEDSEAVKIMTIHQSKGLEFNAVIIPKIQADLLGISKRHKQQIVYYNDLIILSKDLEAGDDTLEYQGYFHS